MAKFAFKPDYVVPPGVTLKETIEDKGISQTDLAFRTGLTTKTISQIINGVAPISIETSEKLEMVTGVPASFWNSLESNYRESLNKREEKKRFLAVSSWLKQIPIKELVERKWIEDGGDEAELVRSALKFFGVSSVSVWNETHLSPVVQYRGGESYERYPGYVATWLQIGEKMGEMTDCESYDEEKFKEALSEVRSLTTKRIGNLPKTLRELCAPAGVAVALVKEIPRASVSGATRWLRRDKALVQLSLKYKSDDQFWFTFFHEAGHVLLHRRLFQNKLVIEDVQDKDSLEEKQANEFARDWLIPRERSYELQYLKSKASVRRFAADIGICPGVVVGRMQHEKIIPPAYMNDLKIKFDWKK